jgi:hypothetical protein
VEEMDNTGKAIVGVAGIASVAAPADTVQVTEKIMAQAPVDVAPPENTIQAIGKLHASLVPRVNTRTETVQHHAKRVQQVSTAQTMARQDVLVALLVNTKTTMHKLIANCVVLASTKATTNNLFVMLCLSLVVLPVIIFRVNLLPVHQQGPPPMMVRVKYVRQVMHKNTQALTCVQGVILEILQKIS